MSQASTPRFAEKRETILDGAARLFNRRGIKAGTLSEVAASVGLATNSLTYYYRKKEDLICACLMRSIDAARRVIDEAALTGDLAARVRALFTGYGRLMADVAEGRHPELIFFGDMRALPQPQAEPVFAAYVEMFRALRRLVRDPAHPAPAGDEAQARRWINARTHVVQSQLLWMRAWLHRFESSDHVRVSAALADLLLHGLARPGTTWPGDAELRAWPAVHPCHRHPQADGESAEAQGQREAYLRTATRLINDHGVGGASVERIAATLALTKGSFYHHHDTKHTLVDDCFERSLALIRGAQLAAMGDAQAGQGGWQRLLAGTVPLVQLHGSVQGPLLRLTAWTELPGALRWQKFNTMNQLAERYSAMLVAAMADGSMPLVDPAVGAQLICGMLNGLAEIDHWVAPGGAQSLSALYARPVMLGLLAP